MAYGKAVAFAEDIIRTAENQWTDIPMGLTGTLKQTRPTMEAALGMKAQGEQKNDSGCVIK